MSDPSTLASTERPRLLVDAGWLGAAVVLVLSVMRSGVQVVVQDAYLRPWRIALTMTLVSMFWVATPLTAHAVLQRVHESTRRALALATIAIAMSPLETLWLIAVFHLMAAPQPPGGFLVVAALRLDTNLLIYAAIAGVLWVADANRRRCAVAESTARLRTRASDAELDVLTMQLQPHFLFNALNLVSQLAYESPARAERALRNLRDLLVESTQRAAGSTVTLGEELRFLEAYLDLQRERFGPRLDVRVTADPELRSARVPHMLLQPLVENAIRHGIGDRARGGSIRIVARRSAGDRVVLEVIDDGVGLRPGELREGIGLANVRHRLEQLFSEDGRIAIVGGPDGGTIARLEVPLTATASTDTKPNAARAVRVDTGRVTDIDITGVDRAASGLSETTRRPGLGDGSSSRTDDQRVRRTARAARAAMVILGWAFMAALWTELESVVPIARGIPIPWGETFARNAINAATWLLLTPLVLLLSDAVSERRRSLRVAAHVLGALSFAALHLTGVGLLMRLVGADPLMVHQVRVGWTVWDVVAYAVLVAIARVWAVRERERHDVLGAVEADGRLALARVALLRLQLQPAILLRGLDAVATTVHDPPRCESAITRLGDLMRQLLAVAGEEEAALGDELEMLRAYLDVIGGSFDDVSRGATDARARLPAVIVLPLADAVGARRLRLAIERRRDLLTIECTADATAGDRFLADVDTHALALLESRLTALYGAAFELRLLRQPETVGVRLTIPSAEAPGTRRPEPSPVHHAIA